jgi:hypothetical protein
MVLVAATAVAASTAQAQYTQGDLLGGFTYGSGNDVILDLGSYASLVNGEQWNVGALLQSATVGNHASLAGVQFGVLGVAPAGGPAGTRPIWSTYAGPAGNLGTFTATKFSTFSLPAATLGGLVTTAGSGNIVGYGTDTSSDSISFFNESDPLQVNTWGANYGVDPKSAAFSSAPVVLSTYQTILNGTLPTTQPPLSFTLTADGQLTYGAVAVPEPATYGLLAGLGVLALSVRRQVLSNA